MIDISDTSAAAETSAPSGSVLFHLLRGSSLLFAGRALQAVGGFAAFAITARTLGPGGFGNLAAVLGGAGIVGGMLQAALSDALITRSGGRDGSVLPRLATSVLMIALTAGTFLLVDDQSAGVAVFLACAYVVVSATTAGRTAAARREGRAGALAAANVLGALGSLVAVTVLARANVESWPPYLAAYLAQPLSNYVLRRGGSSDPASIRPSMRSLWSDSRFFILSQTGWLVIGQANVILVRLLVGPVAAGEFATLIRLLDVLAVVAPLVGVLALPVFVAAAGRPTGAIAVARINLFIAGLGTWVLGAGAQFGWVGWQIVTDDAAFPATTFALATAGYLVSASCGIPDRMLQAYGRAGFVAKISLIATVVALLFGTVSILVGGTNGAALSIIVVNLLTNITMLLAAGLPRSALTAHLVLTGLGFCVAGAVFVVTGLVAGLLGAVLVTATVLATLAVVWRRLRAREEEIALVEAR